MSCHEWSFHCLPMGDMMRTSPSGGKTFFLWPDIFALSIHQICGKKVLG